MGLPREPVPLPASQIAELDRLLSEVRHNVQNHLALMVAALELIRRKPDAVPRVIDNILEQPQRVTDEIKRFALEFEKALKIKRD
jgi:hypothetical protein